MKDFQAGIYVLPFPSPSKEKNNDTVILYARVNYPEMLDWIVKTVKVTKTTHTSYAHFDRQKTGMIFYRMMKTCAKCLFHLIFLPPLLLLLFLIYMEPFPLQLPFLPTILRLFLLLRHQRLQRLNHLRKANTACPSRDIKPSKAQVGLNFIFVPFKLLRSHPSQGLQTSLGLGGRRLEDFW